VLCSQVEIEIDISYLYRVTLWPVVIQDSYKIGLYQARNIPILDIHELAAGKLAALMSRNASRDLYDTHQLANLLTNQKIDKDRLRLAFIVFGAMSRRDWRTLNVKDIDFDSNELINNLVPVLNQNDLPETNSKKKIVQNLILFDLLLRLAVMAGFKW
jgi:predicted nucleotidyltransferase component of viral defense system